MFQIIIYLTLCISLGSSQEFKTHYTIYNRINSSEATYWVTYRSADPEISKYHFDAPKTRECFRGIFFTPYEKNYSANPDQWASSTEVCEDYPDPIPIESVRPVGDPDDFTRNSLTFYEGIGYSGPQHLFLGDMPSFGNSGIIYQSLALTGSSPLTICNGENYSGLSICIQPQKWRNLVTLIYTIETELGINPEDIKSIRFGCFSKVIFSNV